MSTDPNYPPQPDPDYGASPPPPEFASTGYENRPYPDRSEAASKKLAAGITGILLGTFGVHKFILGYTTAGAIMLVTNERGA